MRLDVQPGVLVNLSRFEVAEGAIRQAVGDGVTEVAFAIEQRAKYNVTEVGAVDTGALRASIYTASLGDSNRDQAISEAEDAAATEGRHSGRPHEFTPAMEGTVIGSDLKSKVGVAAEYGIYIEFGTFRSSERPYLNPAVEAVSPMAEPLIARLVRNALGGMG